MKEGRQSKDKRQVKGENEREVNVGGNDGSKGFGSNCEHIYGDEVKCIWFQ